MSRRQLSEKGFQLLARAWPAIHAKCPKAKLSVVGSGKLYRRDCELGGLGIAAPGFEKEITQALGSDPGMLGVEFHGLVSPDNYHQILDSCSIGVVNPWWQGSFETFCNAAVELQSRGIPVVGGNAGGLRETVRNRKTGLLISSDKGLQAAVISLLANPVKTQTMGKQALCHAARFTSDGILNSWRDLISILVAGQHLKPPRFSLRRATAKNGLREIIRQARRIPGVDSRLPTLSEMKKKG